MATRKVYSGDRAGRPAMSPEAREQQMIALAVDCAERQMREGTATSAIICHYLKLGTEKERLERQKLEAENELLKAKAKAIEDAKTEQELYLKALDAMKRYSGNSDDSESPV